jgi:hypothetical protein
LRVLATCSCLDDHRILVANALEESSFVTLMTGKRASMILSDPPYNLRIENFVSGLGKIRHPNFAMASGEMSEAEFIVFLRRICSLFARHSYNGSLHYLFIDWRHVGELLTAVKGVYSGSTVLAAERTGRSCYGMEIDPLYVDTAIRRWQNYTRDRARHALTDRLFDEIEAEREGHHGDR